MRDLFLFLSAVLIIATSCSESSTERLQPLGISRRAGENDFQESCHCFMRMISNAEFRYYAANNEYSEDLLELQQYLPVPIESIACPVNGEYMIQVTQYPQDSYIIECPSDAAPSHGHILDGFQSWPCDPSEYEDFCHSNMTILASACACYYGKYNTYPDSLSDMQEFFSVGMDMICCPLNGQFLYYGDEQGYCITCPSEQGMSHGFIEDGIPSWTR